MATFIKSVFKRTGEFFHNTEKKKLILLISLAAVVIVASIIGTVLLNQVKYTVLYSGLDASEAGKIKTVLDGKSVKSKVQGTSTILVPEDQADTLRVQLASEGYPSTGLNYDIFSGSSAIGSTDLERRTYLQYQLQENISRAIKSFFDKVQDSIVIVNLAKDSSFVVSDNTSAASVAVMLKLKNNETLTNNDAKTIGQFVLKSVPDLKLENISIVDSKMKSYDITSDGESSNQEYSVTQLQLTEQMKDTLNKQVMHVLEPAMGVGNVTASVNLTLNFDKQTVDKVEFAPPVEGDSAGLPRSSEEQYNNKGGAAATTSGAAGTDTNGVGTPAYVAGATPSPGGDTSTTKTYNYELNQIKTQIEKAQGTIQDLSVAVLVNSNVKDVGGYLDKVKNLVAQSIGVKPDYISVEQMPFADNSANDPFQSSQETQQQLIRKQLITTIVTIAALLAAVIVIARFFIRKPNRAAVENGIGNPQVVGLTPGDLSFDEAAENYDLSDLVLKKSTEAEKIEELMDRYPETVAQILRTWIAEDN